MRPHVSTLRRTVSTNSFIRSYDEFCIFRELLRILFVCIGRVRDGIEALVIASDLRLDEVVSRHRGLVLAHLEESLPSEGPKTTTLRSGYVSLQRAAMSIIIEQKTRAEEGGVEVRSEVGYSILIKTGLAPIALLHLLHFLFLLLSSISHQFSSVS